MSRLDRQQYFLQIAKVVSQRSTCPRLAVGAVIVDEIEKKLLSTGYNGSPHGAKHCEEVGCIIENNHCIRAIHAETNAVLHIQGVHSKNLILYCTHFPCLECLKILYTSGIRFIFYIEEYNSRLDINTLFPNLEIRKCEIK